MDWVVCTWCGKNFLKDRRRINENIRLGHNFYCSKLCQFSARSKQQRLNCENPNCEKIFKRSPGRLSSHNFCSRSCAAIINNSKFPKRVAIVRYCAGCEVKLLNHKKYCSTKCKCDVLTISKTEVIMRIKDFCRQNGRIPVKREFWGIYKPARKYFGTWNKAIEAAGFDPNPVLFAQRHKAKDGHICDSIAEMIIDNYLFEKRISHERNFPYPEGSYTADFKIGDILIEYFGLAGEHKRYDELRKIKQEIVRIYKLSIVEIYPEDLYPKNNLDKIL